MSEKKAAYFITTPYIDAYVYGGDMSAPITYDEFVTQMEMQALSWGEQSVGRAVLGKSPPAMFDTHYVLAMGRWDGRMFIYVNADGGTVWEEDWLYEWDVT